MRLIISVDISSDERRRQVVQRLCRCCHRIQFSVFEGEVSELAWEKAWKDLVGLINPETDALLMLPHCGHCERSRREAGCSQRLALGEDEVL